jgi:hypothetical protein
MQEPSRFIGIGVKFIKTQWFYPTFRISIIIIRPKQSHIVNNIVGDCPPIGIYMDIIWQIYAIYWHIAGLSAG